MVTSLKKQVSKLNDPDAALTDDQKKDLERKRKFLDEYQACKLFDPRKSELLTLWQGDKSLKTWAEATVQHSEQTSHSSQSKQSYGTLYDVAKIMNLDISQPPQKKLLDKALLKLESDDLWSETNPLEQTYKEEGLKRYHFSVFLGNTVDHTVKDEANLK
ncbi:unnamed protein product, partial [Symbiodinium necroappetens]